METTININQILSQVKQLEEKDQLTLLQRLASLIVKTKSKDSDQKKLSSISGLGSEIWTSKKDIDLFIDGERQW